MSSSERRVMLATTLLESLGRPLTAPGSERLADKALAQYDQPERVQVLLRWVDKLLETLADGTRHDTLALATGDVRIALWFVAWPGTVHEVQPTRWGSYLGELAGMGQGVARMGLQVDGLLEIDAYVREWDDASAPAGLACAVDVEYSFLPGTVIGGRHPVDPELAVVLVNEGLCSDGERQTLAAFKA